MLEKENRLLIYIVPCELKDDVIDQLISLPELSGFSLGKISGYSREHSHFSVLEQVEGCREFYRFEILHQAGDTEKINQKLMPVCGSAQARYWEIPVFSSGSLSE